MSDLDDVVARIVADGDRRRHERATRMVEAMTEREARLVREAAVMGFVHGRMSGDSPFPRDTQILHQVLLGCDMYSDTYPVIGGLGIEQGEDDQ